MPFTTVLDRGNWMQCINWFSGEMSLHQNLLLCRAQVVIGIVIVVVIA